MTLPITLLLGLSAGTLTTVAGLGGGMLLILALSHLVDPHWALAASALPLLLGNVHRSYMFRAHLSWRHATMLCAGAVPGALVGGLITTQIPAAVVHWLLLAMTAMAVARGLKLWSWRPQTTALAPAGAAIGMLTATAGGGGLLIAPLLLTSGVKGEAYIATASAVAASMHIARLAGYGIGGMIDADLIRYALALAAAIIVGNALGKRLRGVLSERRGTFVMYGTLVMCTILAISGLR